MLRFWRLLLWRRRLGKARDDVAHYRSAVLHYSQCLRAAKERLEVVEGQIVDVDYPRPRGVTGAAA